MHMRMCMCIYIHMYTCICICVYITVYTYIYTHVHTYIHTYRHACMHTYIDTYTHTDTHAHPHTYIYIYISICIHTYMYSAYIDTYRWPTNPGRRDFMPSTAQFVVLRLPPRACRPHYHGSCPAPSHPSKLKAFCVVGSLKTGFCLLIIRTFKETACWA